MNDFDILNSVDVDDLIEKGFLSVSDRYYEHKYCTKFSTPEWNLDHRVSFHTNRICMISLAENHPVIKDKKTILKINCVVDKIDRLANTALGKGKRGAQKLNPTSVLCYIECGDGSCYPVHSCVKGKLLEINEKLLANPELIREKPVAEGYLALILPMLKEFDDVKDSMLSKEDYFKAYVKNNDNTNEEI